MFLLCLESLVLKHLRPPYPCHFIWQQHFWRHLLPYIGTNLQVSVFCLGFLVTKFWSNLICLGKQRKMGKTKTAFEKKIICDAIVVSFNFLLRVQKIIHNHLRNCPNFCGLPPLAGRHKSMTAVYLFMLKSEKLCSW